MKLGTVTYNLAKDWNIDTMIEKCAAAGFEGVELRTTHAHGVELTLNAAERKAVKQKFEGSKVELVGLGSTYEYHAIDPAELRRNIEGTKEYAVLARDVGASGIKVRPNRLMEKEGVPVKKTLEQIGLALRECGEFAKDYGVQIRLEVHGGGTSYIPYIATILDIADHDNVVACWNSNANETVDGSLKPHFDLLKGRIGLVHMRDLYVDYPFRELFELLHASGYDGYCLSEIADTSDPDRVMKYYKGMWNLLTADLG